MRWYRCLIALFFSFGLWFSALPGYAQQPASVPTSVSAVEETAPAAAGWQERLRALIPDGALDIGKRVVLTLLLFFGGWFVAKLFAYGVYRALLKTDFDDKLAEKLGIKGLLEDGDKKRPKVPNALERMVANVVYYLLMLLVVVGVLQFAGLTQVATPIQGLVNTIVQALPQVGKAILILVAAYFIGLILQKGLSRLLSGLKLDHRFAELSEGSKEGAEASTEETKERPFSENVGRLVFWLVIVVGLASAFQALEITAISVPLQNVIDQIVNVIPLAATAAAILFGGYVLGRLVRTVVKNLLSSAGFDKLIKRIGVDKLFGKSTASEAVGTVVMAFILLQAGIAALNRLKLETLSAPLTSMVSQFWEMLPSISVAVLLVALGVLGGRLARNILVSALKNAGFDRLLERLGFEKLKGRSEHLDEPSELVGIVAYAAIILLAANQALEHLSMDTLAAYLSTFLSYSVRHIAVAFLIVGLGFLIGNYVRDLIQSRRESQEESINWLAEIARYTVLVFAFTMAVQHLGVAENFVLVSFALLFGGLCLAVSLAFGLGSREVAADIVKKRYEKAREKPEGGPALGSGEVAPKTGNDPKAGG